MLNRTTSKVSEWAQVLNFFLCAFAFMILFTFGGMSTAFALEHSDTVVSTDAVSSSVSLSEKKIMWLEASYSSSETGVVRVLDSDANLNSEKIDNFDVDVWSDTDFAGIDLTLTETGDATGIFEGTVFFTTTDDTSGHRLLVSQVDTIYSKYGDNTEPESFDVDDNNLISTASINGVGVNVEDRVSLDKKSYVWNDVATVSIIAPEENFDRTLIDVIDSSDNSVKITTRHFEINSYLLVETGVNTGKFVGQIPLADKHDEMDSDGISIFFEYEEDLVAIGSAPITKITQTELLDTLANSNVPSVSFDRSVYPVPFGEMDNFEDVESFSHSGRSIFPLHNTAITTGKILESETLGNGDVTVHIRVSDDNFDVSSQNEDKINQDVAGKKVGPLKISISRNSQIMTLAYAGGSTPNQNGLIDINNNNPNDTRQMGPISEVSPDSGIFEIDLAIRYTDGPHDPKCPATAVFTSLNDDDDTLQDSEVSRFDEPSADKENYCILKGDVLTVEYYYIDESGNSRVASDSATFQLRDGILESDKDVYIIGSDMILTLTDPDLDLDNDVAETYSLDLIEWDSAAATLTMGELGGDIPAFDPEPSHFRETGDSTGIFQIVIEIPEELHDEHLERGEEVVLEYTDWGSSDADYVGDEDEDVNHTIYTSNFGATVDLDKKIYFWNDKVAITITANDHNFDSNLIDEIGDNDHYPVTISTRDFTLDQYKLVETGADTGVFKGTVKLFGNTHDSNSIPTGTGPTDGLIPVNNDNNDGFTVAFEFSEDETVVGSALVRLTAQMEISPLKQTNSGVLLGDVVCNNKLFKMYQHDGSVACVKLDSISKLMERGWNRY